MDLGCEPLKTVNHTRSKNLPRLAERPEDLFPPNLTIVFRVDLKRLRNAASHRSLDAIRDVLNRRWTTGSKSTLLDLLRAEATTLWGGLRGVPSQDRLDAVLVARGEFASFDPAQEDSWVRTPSMHPGYAIFERQGDIPRDEPSLLAILENRTLVLATRLEAAIVRRSLEQGGRASRLEPPANGLFSLVSRSSPLIAATRERYPHLASVLTELSTIEFVIDTDVDQNGGLRTDLRLSTQTPTGAERVERVLLGWKDALESEDDPLVRSLAKVTRIERDGPMSIHAALRSNHEDTVALIKRFSDHP